MKLLTKVMAASMMLNAALLTGCADPSLPDPTLQCPIPPSILMEPPEKLKPIPTEETNDRR